MTTNGNGSGRDYCGANRRQGEGTCTRPAGWGTNHVGVGRCKLHGGNTSSHKANALTVTGQQEVSKWGARRDVHPAEALLELVQWKATEVDFWQSKVDGLGDDELTWGRTKLVTGGVHIGRDGDALDNEPESTEEAVPHIYIKLLHEAQKALADFAASCIRAGVDQVLVQAAQQRAVVWLAVMRRMLADSRVSVDGDPEDVLFEALRTLREVGA